MDLVDDEAGHPGRVREAPPRGPDGSARGGGPLPLGGGLARGHERDPGGDDPWPRVGRRGRLARPCPDADAGAHGQARARDPGVRAPAVPPRARPLRGGAGGGVRRSLVRGRRDADLRRARAGRPHRRARLRRERDGRVRRAEGADRARAAPLRPHLAAARREPALRLLRAPHPPGGAVALRGQEGAHLSADVVPLPHGGHGRGAQADGGDAAADSRLCRGGGVRARARRAPPRPHRQRREGGRPPRDHPDRRRPRRLGVLAGRAAGLRPRRPAVPRGLPPACPLRADDGDHRGRWRAVPHPGQGHTRGRLARRVRARGGRGAQAGRGG